MSFKPGVLYLAFTLSLNSIFSDFPQTPSSLTFLICLALLLIKMFSSVNVLVLLPCRRPSVNIGTQAIIHR